MRQARFTQSGGSMEGLVTLFLVVVFGLGCWLVVKLRNDVAPRNRWL